MKAVRKEEVNVIPITKEMKQIQKELSEIYREELAQYVWKKDPKMVKYCVDKTAWYIELPNGLVIPIDKKHIETRFCFGYSTCGQGAEYDDAIESASTARKSVTHFIRENMAYYDDLIEWLSDENKRHTNPPFLRVEYWSLAPNSIFRSITSSYNYGEAEKYWYKQGEWVLNGNNIDYVPTFNELDLIIGGLKIARQIHYKKVMAYLKRYGLSKIDVWTYWVDE